MMSMLTNPEKHFESLYRNESIINIYIDNISIVSNIISADRENKIIKIITAENKANSKVTSLEILCFSFASQELFVSKILKIHKDNTISLSFPFKVIPIGSASEED